MSLLAVVAPAAFGACVLGVLLGIAVARRRYVVVTVAGASMAPALEPGDQVLVRRRRGPFPGGTIVVFAEPASPWPGAEPDDGWPDAATARAAGDRWVIKRVAAVPGDAVPESVRPAVSGTEVVPPGMLVVLGDGARSGDSRQWGFIPTGQVMGLVVRKLPGKAGRDGASGRRKPRPAFLAGEARKP